MPKREEWFNAIKAGDVKRVVLIHFDLARHSRWHREIDRVRRTRAYRWRKELAERLQDKLENYDVFVHHWSGDGGLFVVDFNHPRDANRAYDAMVDMHKEFHQWQERRDPTGILACRIVGTYIPDVYADRDPGYWSSPKLNEFLKYERDIGYEDAIVVTDDLHMNFEDSCDIEFTEYGYIKEIGHSSMQRYYDKRHPVKVLESSDSFGAWTRTSYFHELLASIGKPRVRVDRIPKDGSQLQIRDALVISPAGDPDGYDGQYIELFQLDGTNQRSYGQQQRREPFPYDPDHFQDHVLCDEDHKDWCHETKRLEERNVRGTKLCVQTIRTPRGDDPYLSVRWSRCSYVDAKAFHTIAENSPDSKVPRRYLKDAHAVFNEGNPLPSTLCGHVLVVFGQGRDRKLVMCHRNASRPGGYWEGRWSVSFEEHFSPAYNQYEEEGRSIRKEPDSSLKACVARGIREEILGKDYNKDWKITVHGLLLETLILNFGFLALVELPDESKFEAIRELWDKAPERREHDAIAALPMERNVLETCLKSDDLPESIRKSRGHLKMSCELDYFDGDQFSGEQKQQNPHLWHPTSPARLALALWRLESGE